MAAKLPMEDAGKMVAMVARAGPAGGAAMRRLAEQQATAARAAPVAMAETADAVET